MLSVISNKKAWIWSEWSVAVVLLNSCGWGGQRTGADQWSVDIMGIIIRQMSPSRPGEVLGAVITANTLSLSAHLQTQLS